MDDFEISEYLEAFNKPKHAGICKGCKKTVDWSRARVAGHIRGNCKNATQAQKKFFAKRKHNGDPAADASLNDNNEIPRKDIDDALGNFFFRTGIAFRVADSPAWKHLIHLLNPIYADGMPSAKTLSTRLLDEKYETSSAKVREILENAENLVLTSDGWTNVRGDHIVNFIVQAPGKAPFFYIPLAFDKLVMQLSRRSSKFSRK